MSERAYHLLHSLAVTTARLLTILLTRTGAALLQQLLLTERADIRSPMRQVRACPSAPTPSQSWPRRPGIGWHSSFTFASQRRWPYINQTRRLPPRDRLAPHAGLNFDSVIKQEPSRRALPPFSSIILHYLGRNYCNKTATYCTPVRRYNGLQSTLHAVRSTGRKHADTASCWHLRRVDGLCSSPTQPDSTHSNAHRHIGQYFCAIPCCMRCVEHSNGYITRILAVVTAEASPPNATLSAWLR